jgi:hypothetical protein
MGAMLSRSDDRIPPALAAAFASGSTDPFKGLPYPLESTRLIIRVGEKLALALTGRGWSLVGGISKSIAPGDDHFSDFRPPVDRRYLVTADRQLLPSEQEKVTVESPIKGLMRETEEELTSDWTATEERQVSEGDHPELAWLLDRVRTGKWTAMIARKNRLPVIDYRTHVCLALIDLTKTELAALNATISEYPSREMSRFETFTYSVVQGRIEVGVPAGERLRTYDSEVIFGDYAETVLELLKK